MKKNVLFIMAITFLCLIEYCDAPPQNIYMATIPKAGTNLLAKTVALLTGRNATRYETQKLMDGILPETTEEILFSHCAYDEDVAALFEHHNYLGLFMLRDPRDVAVSRAFWRIECPNIYPEIVEKYKKDPTYFDKVLSAQIRVIKKSYDRFLPWMKNKYFYTVHFENLVGREGGGSRKKQLRELSNISHHLGLAVPEAQLQEYAQKLFGGTVTFRKGQIGGWKHYFKSRHEKLFKKVTGTLLIDLGYELDNYW